MTSTPSERLEQARQIRVRTALAANELKNARIALCDVLGNAQHVLGNASIEYVLCHTPGLGVKGARKVLRDAGGGKRILFHWKKTGKLTEAEVQAIIRCLLFRVHAKQPITFRANEPRAPPG